MRPVTSQAADAIVVEHLRVLRGGREVLPDLSLRVPNGQVVGLLGPSGGGKSTLMRAVVGVQVVDGGSVSVLGEPAGAPALRHRVGYLTQAPSVYADLTVRENVRYLARVVGVGADAVDRAIEAVDLADHADVRVEKLSGGQLSRASLACTLVGDPDVLVLDEPTVGLDPVLRRDLWDIFRDLAAQGRTLLVSSHVMDEAVRCDRLLLLRAGHVLSDSTLPELLSRTGTDDPEQAFLALIDEADARDGGGPVGDERRPGGEEGRHGDGRHLRQGRHVRHGDDGTADDDGAAS
ncbi:MAG TPA: ABC transporter ATP-binding protein [Phycicoccus sp.]|nr:ABC transporter ATP-binding protein [Phycicoccus sp.]